MTADDESSPADVPAPSKGRVSSQVPAFAAVGAVGYVVDSAITYAGAKYLGGRPTSPVSFYEAKYRNPDGVVFDLTHKGLSLIHI